MLLLFETCRQSQRKSHQFTRQSRYKPTSSDPARPSLNSKETSTLARNCPPLSRPGALRTLLPSQMTSVANSRKSASSTRVRSCRLRREVSQIGRKTPTRRTRLLDWANAIVYRRFGRTWQAWLWICLGRALTTKEARSTPVSWPNLSMGRTRNPKQNVRSSECSRPCRRRKGKRRRSSSSKSRGKKEESRPNANLKGSPLDRQETRRRGGRSTRHPPPRSEKATRVEDCLRFWIPSRWLEKMKWFETRLRQKLKGTWTSTPDSCLGSRWQCRMRSPKKRFPLMNCATLWLSSRSRRSR